MSNLTRSNLNMSTRVYLSLGSNLGDREQNIRAAVARLDSVGTVLAVSSLYETEPVEFTAQPWFLNCVVDLETKQPPQELLRSLLSIEHAMGRQRTSTKGPRTIDLDILLYADRLVREPGLEIPHPALAQRRFVLVPLTELAPDLVHPALHKTMLQLNTELQPGQSVRKVGKLEKTEKIEKQQS
jgi:2-amino-4-hydroxy-6-hydroxymethyldihydropteridine diphosphokinase